MPAPGPSPPPRPEGWTGPLPDPTGAAGAGREGGRGAASAPRAAADQQISPRHPRQGAPARARTRPAPRPAALSSCRKFQKLSIIPAQRARAAKAPRRRATCRPAARPALAPPSLPAGQPRRAGRAGGRAGTGRPFPHPGWAECVAAPAGGYFEREGSGPASVFSAFSWPPAHQPGPSAARGVGGGGHVAGRRAGRGGGAAIRLWPRPERRPAAVRTRAPGGRVINSARPGVDSRAQAPLPARPSAGSTGGPGTPSPVTDAGLTGQRRGAPAANHRPRFPYLEMGVNWEEPPGLDGGYRPH